MIYRRRIEFGVFEKGIGVANACGTIGVKIRGGGRGKGLLDGVIARCHVLKANGRGHASSGILLDVQEGLEMVSLDSISLVVLSFAVFLIFILR